MKEPRSQKIIRRGNFILMIAWIILLPVSIYFGWIYSLAFISAASIYANIASHLAAWRADEDPVEQEICRRLTEIEKRLKAMERK